MIEPLRTLALRPTILIVCLLSGLTKADFNQFDCATLATEEAIADGGMDMVKSFINEFGQESTFDAE